MAYVNPNFTQKPWDKRVAYGEEHQYKTIEDFWQFVFFTDEAYINTSFQQAGRILPEAGAEEAAQNTREG